MKTLVRLVDRRYVIGLVLVLHVVGLVALATPLAQHVVPLTPFNLIFTAGAMILFARLDRRTVALALILGTLGYFVEVLGVWTGRVFGSYTYGDVLGMKLLNVPLLIGLNWSMLVFAIGAVLEPLRLPILLKLVLGSAAMVALDLLIEPVAVHLGFWSWDQGDIPLQNYLAWGGISAVFFTILFMAPVRRENPVASAVLLAQVVFFAGLNLVLGVV